MEQTAKKKRPTKLAQAVALLILALIALGIRERFGFEVAVILLLVFIWNALPTKSDIREIVQQTTKKQP